MGSIMRRSLVDGLTDFNVITFCTHERYEQSLSKTGHNFYSLKLGKVWNSDYGSQPNNYHQVNRLPEHLYYDLVLCQDMGRYREAKKVAEMYSVPLVMLTHTLPDVRYSVEKQISQLKSLDVDQHVFISDFSKKAWGFEDVENANIICHGLDVEFWGDCDRNRQRQIVSVANLFPQRDWCLGWEFWCATLGFNKETGQADFPINLVGNNQPYSAPAHSIQDLRKQYHESSIFFNSSIHSPVPMSLMEAMACGCAIVSTETCMIPEIIENGVNGILSNDPDTLRFHLEKLINDPEMCEEMGKKAQETIQEYNLDNFTEKWNSLFNRTVKEYESILLEK
jgi:hypothetical protein